MTNRTWFDLFYRREITFLERDLRFVGIASSAMLGKHAPNGDYFNIVAIVTSIKGDTAIYKVS